MRDTLAYLLFRVLVLACRLVGERGSVALGRLLGVAYGAMDSRRARVLRNMSKAVGPARARRLLPKYHEHIGLLAVEYARLAALRDPSIVVTRWIDASAAEKLKAPLAAGRGVIVMTAHVGNWELTGYALASAVPLNSLYRPSGRPKLDAIARAVRERSGQRVREKFDSMRWSLRVLRSAQVLGLLMDQDGGPGGVFVPFFGELASTLSTAARLARRTGAAIVPIWSARLPGGLAHRLYVGDEIPLADTGDERSDVLLTTRRCNEAIEKMILANPAQWLWTHRRWRTRPAAEDVAAWERARSYASGREPAAGARAT